MILIGTKCQLEQTVTDELTASQVGSGALPVFGTPFMIAMMENAALTVLQSFLDEGQGSVGTNINVSHLAASPIGMSLRAESELTAVDRRMLSFRVRAYAGAELIGEGSHQRCLIMNDRFMEKTQAKLK